MSVVMDYRDHLTAECAARYYITQADVVATHPMASGAPASALMANDAAMILVGERHAKSDLVDLVRALLLRADAWAGIQSAPKDVIIIGVWFGAPTEPESTEVAPVMFDSYCGEWVNPDDDLDRFCQPDMWMPYPTAPPNPAAVSDQGEVHDA